MEGPQCEGNLKRREGMLAQAVYGEGKGSLVNESNADGFYAKKLPKEGK